MYKVGDMTFKICVHEMFLLKLMINEQLLENSKETFNFAKY